MRGSEHVVFLVGAAGRRQMAVAQIADGLLVRRLAHANGDDVRAIAGSPDGKTVFYMAAGVVWSVPTGSGEPRQILRGDFVAVDPRGQYHVVQANDTDTVRLHSASLSGDQLTDIVSWRDLRTAADSGLAPNAIHFSGWSAQGDMVGVAFTLRSRLWRFRPVRQQRHSVAGRVGGPASDVPSAGVRIRSESPPWPTQ